MLESFMNYLVNVKGKPLSTAKMYLYDVQQMIRFLDSKKIKVQKAKKDDLYKYMTYLAERGIKPVTRARQCSSIRVFYSWLNLKHNPALELCKPKIEKREVMYLNLTESVRLLKLARKKEKRNSCRNLCIITLFLNLGLRLSELVLIDIEDINFDTKQIKIKGKGGKDRTLYLNEQCLKTINQYRKARKTGALFLSEQKKRISRRMVEYIVENKVKTINSKITPHKLRHTFATNLYQSGFDIRLLQKILGHENISTTEIYVHVKDEQVKEAINKLGGIYEKL